MPTSHKTLALTGYIRFIDGSNVIIDGCRDAPWSSLPKHYFFKGVCRHVAGDRSSCTVKVPASTKCTKDGADCTIADLAGCYVRVVAHIVTYKFWSAGASIEGWNIVAAEVKKVKIPVA